MRGVATHTQVRNLGPWHGAWVKETNHNVSLCTDHRCELHLTSMANFVHVYRQCMQTQQLQVPWKVQPRLCPLWTRCVFWSSASILEATITRSLGLDVPSLNWIWAERVSIFLILFLPHLSRVFLIELILFTQQMEPAKQAKVMQEFQRQSAQMDMTVSHFLTLPFILVLLFFVWRRLECKCQPFWL